MKRTVLIGIILATALAVAVPNVLMAQQGRQGKGMGPGMGPGMGMMGSSPCPQMMGKGMMGMGPWAEKLSDADRGELLVLKGQLMKKHAEIMKKQAEAMIAEGQRLLESGK